MQLAVISDVCFSYYSLRLEAIVAFCGHFGFLAEEMADGRHGVLMGNFSAGLMEVLGDELMNRVVCIRQFCANPPQKKSL